MKGFVVRVATAVLVLGSVPLFGEPGRVLAEAPRPDSQIALVFPFQEQDVVFGEHRGFDTIALRNCVMPRDEPGTPALPVQYVNVLVPAGAKVIHVSATADEALFKKGISVLPVQPSAPTSKQPPAFVEPDATIYAGQEKFPAELVRQEGGVHHARGWTFVSIRLNPLRYIPAKSELYLARQIQVTVQYELPGRRPAGGVRESPVFKSTIRKWVVNPDLAGAEPEYSTDVNSTKSTQAQPTGVGSVDYLIITSDGLTNAFQRLADHRAAHNGFSVMVVSTSTIYSNYDGTRPSGGSDNPTRIRNCISNYVYNSNTLYVVLGGDDVVVPDRHGYITYGGYIEDDTPIDLYYAGLDGTWDADADGRYGEAYADATDLAADVFVGRIPVRTEAQASNYINKVISYDNNPPWPVSGKYLMGGNYLWDSYSADNRPPFNVTAKAGIFWSSTRTGSPTPGRWRAVSAPAARRRLPELRLSSTPWPV